MSPFLTPTPSQDILFDINIYDGGGGGKGSELHYLFQMAWVKLEIIIWDKKDV